MGICVITVAIRVGKSVSIVVRLVQPFIDLTVAVIVHAVKDLLGTREDCRVVVIAISLVLAEAIPIIIEAVGSLIHDPVTVVIDSITDLRGTGIAHRVFGLAVPCGLGVAILVRVVDSSVRRTVAVIVNAIGRHLKLTWVDRTVAVVTVAFVLSETIPVVIKTLGALIDGTVTVIVDAVASLGRNRAD
jgi:hypothetical protein